MDKKLIGLFLSFFVLLFSVGNVLALEIGYVVSNPSLVDSADLAVKNFLISEGHAVNFIDDSLSFNAGNYHFIIVSDSVNNIGNSFDHKNYRTLFLGNSAARNEGISSSSGTSSGRYLTVERSHEITIGYSLGDLNVYNSVYQLEYLTGCFAKNAYILASKSDSGRPIILALDTNALLIDSGCTDRDIAIFERNLYFGIVEAENWNSDAKILFRKSIDWLMDDFVDPDMDNDGYDSIDEGGLDCNDNDADINPGASEIAYNGIDEDCNGEDLIDVDDDGYDAEVAGGDDCDDNDSTIHPGAIDSEKDCVDDNTTNTPNTADEITFSSKVDVCSVENSAIEIDFINVNNGKNYEIGDTIDFSVRISNEFSEDKEFEVKAYFYDASDNEVIDDSKDDLKVDSDENKIITFSFDVDVDLDENHEYVLLVVASDGECNQEYVEIDIERQEHELMVRKVEVSPSELVCGAPFTFEVYIDNLGSRDEDAYIIVKNNKFKIDEKSEGFELDSYGGDDDSIKKKFSFAVPDNLLSGEYILRAEVYYGNYREFFDRKITLRACGDESTLIDEEDENGSTVSLGEGNDVEENLDVSEENSSKFGAVGIIMAFLLVVFAGVAGFVVYNFWYS